MKTRTLVLIPIFIFVVVAIFIFTACNNDPETPGGGVSFFIYDGTTYSLVSAIIEDYGANIGPGESGYDLDFVAGTFEQAFWEAGPPPGINSIIYLDLNSPNSTLASGTYTWFDTRTDFTLVNAEIILNADFQVGGGTFLFPVGGTVTVSVNNNIYTVEFTLAMPDGKTVTGSYSGPAPVYYI